MKKRSAWVCVLCGALLAGCSSGPTASPDAGTVPGSDGGSPDASSDTSTGPDAGSLTGTWNLTTTPMMGGDGVPTTVTIDRDSLTVTSPAFTLTANRAGNVLTFADDQSPRFDGGNVALLTATQTAGAFNAGILPFDLGGSWTITAGPNGGSPTVTCTLTLSAAEIDGACQYVSPASPWFSFTSQKTSAAASTLGDFGGKWINIWTTLTADGGVAVPCELDFIGNSISTCDGSAGLGVGTPLAGITFTYDGANAVSGAAHGWAEYSATR